MIIENKDSNDGFHEKPKNKVKGKMWRVYYTPSRYHEVEATSIVNAQAKFIDEYGLTPIAISIGTDDQGRPLPPQGFEYVDNKDK